MLWKQSMLSVSRPWRPDHSHQAEPASAVAYKFVFADSDRFLVIFTLLIDVIYHTYN